LIEVEAECCSDELGISLTASGPDPLGAQCRTAGRGTCPIPDGGRCFG